MASENNNSTDSSSSSSPPPPDSSPPPPDTSPPPPDTSSPSQPSPPPPDQSPPPKVSSPPPPENTPTPPPTESESGAKSPPPPPRDSSSGSTPPPAQRSPPPTSNKTPDYSPPPSSSSGSPSPPAKGLPKSQSPPKDSGGSKSSPSSPSSNSSNTVVVVGAAIGGFVILAVVVVCLACKRKKKRKDYYTGPPPPLPGRGEYYGGAQNWNNQPGEHVVRVPPPAGSWGGQPPVGPPSGEQSSVFSGSHPTTNPSPGIRTNQSDFTYEELAAATCGFSEANLLGQGGFGYVHKGVLANGKEVAVKSLKVGSGQGEREFQAEVEIISRVHHRHLVSLVGYCIADGQRMLVYEFVPNKTLEFHLHGKGQPVMEWPTRLRIALGSAKGLAYLHEDCHPRIIHRDIKAANILLDYNNEAMVADFGLAKLSSDNFTHVSTRVMGTFGYLAPEYASSGKLTEKSDVFSFGVMLLELITGRQPVDLTNQYMEDSLVDWARPLLTQALENGNYDELADRRLENIYNPQEMARVISCAAASIRHSARRRPRMSQIVRALEGHSSLDDLNDAKPVISSPINTTPESSIYDTRAYKADMSKFREMVLTDGYASSGDSSVQNPKL